MRATWKHEAGGPSCWLWWPQHYQVLNWKFLCLTHPTANLLRNKSASLTVHRTKLPFMRASEDLFVQGLCLLELSLLQVAGSLKIKQSTYYPSHVREAHSHMQVQLWNSTEASGRKESDYLQSWPVNIPGYFLFWPHWGHQVPVLSGRSRGLSDNNIPLLHTCPGSGTVGPSYLTAWQHLGDPFPKPRNEK